MRQDQQPFAQLLRNQGAYASALLIGLLDELGTGIMNLELPVLYQQIEETWKVEPTELNWDKLCALITVMTTDQFWRDINLFNSTCLALSGKPMHPGTFTPADVDTICWALAELHLVNPPEKGERQVFSEEIKTYILEKLKEEGFTKIPKILTGFLDVDKHNNAMEKDTNAVLEEEPDPIDVKMFWDTQQSRLSALDMELRTNIVQLIDQAASLPLMHSDKDAVEKLRQQARSALT